MIAAPDPDRIVTLDIIRGVAVMGILLMNVIAFAMPEAAYANPRAYGGWHGADLVTWTVEFVLIDGKMRGLFSLLFGASLLLVTDRAEAAGRSAAQVHLARMAWLLVIGIAHLVLLWWGDILAHYALIGLVAFAFRRMLPHQMIATAILLIAVQVWLLGELPFAVAHATAAVAGGHPPGDALRLFGSYRADFGTPSAATLASDMALHHGGYFTLVADRWQHASRLVLGTLWSTGFETLGFMLLGMAALRGGLLGGDWANRHYARGAAVGLGVGVAAYGVLAAILIVQRFDMVTIAWCVIVVPLLLRPAMILGTACLIVLATRHGPALRSRLAATGRMALSNYLGTSLLCTTMFYGYGFAFYGHVGRAQSLIVVVTVWALMLAWSRPWLARFRYGPLEWLWRSLARGRWQRLRC